MIVYVARFVLIFICIFVIVNALGYVFKCEYVSFETKCVTEKILLFYRIFSHSLNTYRINHIYLFIKKSCIYEKCNCNVL